jgi:hypothetical protein
MLALPVGRDKPDSSGRTPVRPYDGRIVAKRKQKDGAGSFLDAVKRIRKPMPPPEQVLADRRRRMLDDDARREIEEAPRRGGSDER